jgi:hypothetical protein
MEPVLITLICISVGLILTSVVFICVSCWTIAETLPQTVVVEWRRDIR